MLFPLRLFLCYNLVAMKIKNIRLSLLILAGLMFLSFAFFVVAQEKSNTQNNVFLDSDQDGLTDAEEKTYGTNPYKADTDGDGYSDGAEVKSGYNPLKPAPGDKIMAITDSANSQVLGDEAKSSDSKEENLTQNVVQKIVDLANNANANSEDGSVNIDQIQSLVEESLNSSQEEVTLPEIKREDVKIKKQDYGNLSEEKAKEKKKQDFIDYITAVFYIMSSNSPKPITSSTDATQVLSQVSQSIISAMTSRDTSSLQDLKKSGEKMLEQLKEVEVPEEMVDTHMKAMSYALYSQQIEDFIKPNADDPLKDLSNFSKIQSFIDSLSQFSDDIQTKFNEYDVKYDDVKDKLKDYGIDVPQNDSLLEKLSE